MDKISCDVCLDLMALVRDGAGSKESREAVEAHVKSCKACRVAFEEAAVPEAESERALQKAVQRVKKISAVAAVVFVLMGICLCELVFQGSSMVFLVVVLLIRWLLTVGTGEGSGWMAFMKRTLARIMAVALILGLLALGNVVYGNPVSKKLAAVAAQAYLDGMGLECGACIQSFSHDAKRGMYDFEVVSENSRDTWFTIMVRPDGTVRNDTYYAVVTGERTADRLLEEFENLAEPVLDKIDLGCAQAVCFAELDFEQKPWEDSEYISQFFLNGQPLVPDGEYDILEVGTEVGKILIVAEDETVSAGKAAEILLKVRRSMEEAGVPFATVDLMLQHPSLEDGSVQKEERVEVLDFPYEQIRKDGLTKGIEDWKKSPES